MSVLASFCLHFYEMTFQTEKRNVNKLYNIAENLEAAKMLSNFVASEDKGNAEVRPPTAGTECGQPRGGCVCGLPFLLNIKNL